MLHVVSLPVLAPWLLAQANPFSDLSKRFQTGGSEFPIGQVVALVVLLLLIAVALWKVARISAQREGRSHFSSRRLFDELCACTNWIGPAESCSISWRVRTAWNTRPACSWSRSGSRRLRSPRPWRRFACNSVQLKSRLF